MKYLYFSHLNNNYLNNFDLTWRKKIQLQFFETSEQLIDKFYFPKFAVYCQKNGFPRLTGSIFCDSRSTHS